MSEAQKSRSHTVTIPLDQAKEELLRAIDRYGNAWEGTPSKADAWTKAVEAVDHLLLVASQRIEKKEVSAALLRVGPISEVTIEDHLAVLGIGGGLPNTKNKAGQAESPVLKPPTNPSPNTGEKAIVLKVKGEALP